MDTAQTVERLTHEGVLAELRFLESVEVNPTTKAALNQALTLLQNKEKDTELLNAADDAWKPGEAHCVEITWGCGTHYKTCREALSELVAAIAAQQEAERVETDQQKGEG